MEWGLQLQQGARCGNTEEDNKYWLEKGKKEVYILWERRGQFIKEHEIAREWFAGVGEDEGERLE